MGNSPSTVIQFYCIERERRSFGDDGTYSQYNHSHVRLMSQLMVYVHAQLEHWYPVMERLCQTSLTKKMMKVKVMAKLGMMARKSFGKDGKTQPSESATSPESLKESENLGGDTTKKKQAKPV